MSGARGKLIVYMCSLIESRNYAAENHCEQIKKFTEIMLEKVRQFCPEYELDEKKCEHIVLASPTHDIGKISIILLLSSAFPNTIQSPLRHEYQS